MQAVLDEIKLKAAWAEWKEEMKFENFCYWLKGMFDAKHADIPLTVAQVELIEKHLKEVFPLRMPSLPTPTRPQSGWNQDNEGTR